MKKRLKICLLVLLSLFAVFIVSTCVLLYIVFTPARLTPVANIVLERCFKKAQVSAERMELAYFSTFPFFSLKLKDVSILSKDNLQDTLAYIPFGTARLNLLELLNRNLMIDNLELKGELSRIAVDSCGRFNWDVFASPANKEKPPTQLDSLFNKIDIKKIHINSGKIIYENAVLKQNGTVENAEILIKGSFLQYNLLTSLDFNLQNISYRDSTIKTYLSDLKLNTEVNISNILSAPSDFLFDNADIKKIHINSGKIIYENLVSKQSATAESAEISLEGSFVQLRLLADADFILQNVIYRDSLIKTAASELKLKLSAEVQDSNIELDGFVGFSKLGFDYDKENFLNDAKLQLSLTTAYNTQSRIVDFKKAVLELNGIFFRLNGSAQIIPSGFKPDISFALNETDLKSLYETIPPKYVQSVDTSLKIFSGSVACSGSVQGEYSEKPEIQVQAALDIKKLKCKFQKFDIDSLNISADCKIPMNNLSGANVHLKKLNYWGDLGKASLLGKVKGFNANPFIEAQVAANLNLRDLKYIMKDYQDFLTEGKVNLDLKGKFKLRDLLEFNPENLNISGEAKIDTVVISNSKDSLNVYIDFARLRFGAQVDDTSFSQGKALLKSSVRLDSLDLNYKNQYVAKIGRLSAGYKCEEEKISSVNTQSARFSVRGFNLQMPKEQIRIRTTRTSARLEIKANPNKPASPLLTLKVSSDTLAYRDRATHTGLRLGSAELNFNLMPIVPRNRNAQTANAQQTRDSTRVRQPPNFKEMSSSEMIKLLISMASEKDTSSDLGQKFLRAFNYDGNLQFSDSRLRLPGLSLPLQIASTTVNMTNRELSLKNAQFYMGNSDLLVTGDLENFRRAMLGRGVLKTNAQIKAKKIDLNELMLALSKKDAENPNAEDSDKNFFDVKLDTTAQVNKIFVIPENLDFNLLVNIDTLLTGRSKLSNLHGDLDLKHQYMHLNNFNLFNQAGQINLKLLYRAQTKKEANLWATLNLDQAQIKDLIDIYPEIDTLLPMTKSLEGLIDCNIQITTKLDSAMNILLPNTIADFRVKGKNLVLLDGETFSEIAKTLMFKNKSRNLMDSISLSLVVKDNAIEIFPMVISIDRYKFAMGGVQNLDMTFNYHVTVLESPLPFKLGIDISGNVDKFNYKIVRPKYRSVEKPAISKEFVDRTVSIQREVQRLIEYEFEHIMKNMLIEEGG